MKPNYFTLSAPCSHKVIELVYSPKLNTLFYKNVTVIPGGKSKARDSRGNYRMRYAKNFPTLGRWSASFKLYDYPTSENKSKKVLCGNFRITQ